MNIVFGLLIWLVISFVVCSIFGTAAKRYRAASMGISEEKDTWLQDKAQAHYLRTGETINVID